MKDNLMEILEISPNYSVLEKNSDIARLERNNLLKQTDWWASTDLTMTDAQTAYRQALRDITAQEGFPDTITWPIKPE
tara:strand:+ start:524 stop:757 length:234 start_codon:yes stop_codon:yes gene_type:complete